MRLSRYELEMAQRFISAFKSENSFERATASVVAALQDQLTSIAAMTMNEFLRWRRSPFHCVYAPEISGVLQNDPVQVALQIDGYLFHNPLEPPFPAFDRARSTLIAMYTGYVELMQRFKRHHIDSAQIVVLSDSGATGCASQRNLPASLAAGHFDETRIDDIVQSVR